MLYCSCVHRYRIAPELSQDCIPENKAKVHSLERIEAREMTQLNHIFQDLYLFVFIEILLYIIFQKSNKDIATFKTISGFAVILGIFFFDNNSTTAEEGKPIWGKVKAKYQYIKKQILCQSVLLNIFNQSRWDDDTTRCFFLVWNLCSWLKLTKISISVLLYTWFWLKNKSKALDWYYLKLSSIYLLMTIALQYLDK